MNDTSAQNATLHPVLQTALASLDLTVEAELAYYRQQQVQPLPLLGETTDLTSEIQHNEIQQSIETESQTLENASTSKTSQTNIEPPPTIALNPVQESTISNESRTEPETLPDAAIIPETELQEAALISTDNLDPARAEGMIEIETPPDAALDSETAEPLNTPPPADFPKSYENYLDPSIEDYLESSEALLRHLEESKAEPEPKPKTQKRLLPGLILILIILSISSVIWGGIRRGQRPVDKPPAETTSPSPSPSLQPSPSIGLPELPITPASPKPDNTASPAPSNQPSPKPTASSIPLQPPTPLTTTSPTPSASPSAP